MSDTPMQTPDFPRIDPVGLDGLLVRFGEVLDEPANRAALAFKAALEGDSPEGVEECATSLVSCFLRFDPLAVAPEALSQRLSALLATRDWYQAALPEGRRFLSIPTVYGTDLAPQLDEAAQLAGMSVEAAIASMSQARVRVTAIGFAPGQPYLGTLPEAWNIPRQTALTPQVPVGALVVAIRQLVLFSVTTPTGWRHVGQTAVRLFQPDSDTPFLLRPGDEVQFPAVSREVFETLRGDPMGGLTQRPLP
ncbi:5-oxoprolinase subunit B family protein [Tropicibacter oceani]|uniref:Allophanate hydrolase subunit 1 n=1 Tax=Tropicibacter oceani TaxID=3058420 RepID=A0ABY8QFS4_9RHOB|nr:allophanate hydrolase subunit 1 [Tropicibacter oceani]WGW03461.1 allophanate hydrolase subunit 1 [Tropicibacter oceani]